MAFARHGYQQSVTKILAAGARYDAAGQQRCRRPSCQSPGQRQMSYRPWPRRRSPSRTPRARRAFIDDVLIMARDQSSRDADLTLELLKTRLGVAVVVVNQEQLIQSHRNGRLYTGGLRIVQVTETPATLAGWKPGDSIVGIDKYAVANLDTARKALLFLGSKVHKANVLLLRGDDTLSDRRQPGPRPRRNCWLAARSGRPVHPRFCAEEQKLKMLLQEKNEVLISKMKDVESLEKSAGHCRSGRGRAAERRAARAAQRDRAVDLRRAVAALGFGSGNRPGQAGRRIG